MCWDASLGCGGFIKSAGLILPLGTESLLSYSYILESELEGNRGKSPKPWWSGLLSLQASVVGSVEVWNWGEALCLRFSSCCCSEELVWNR